MNKIDFFKKISVLGFFLSLELRVHGAHLAITLSSIDVDHITYDFVPRYTAKVSSTSSMTLVTCKLKKEEKFVFST